MRSFSLIAVFLLLSGTTGAYQEAAPATQRLDPMIQKAVSEISEQRITEILKKLESFETRNSLSDPNQPNRGVGAARQWIFDQFKSYSPKLQVSFDSHQVPKGGRVWKDTEIRNVVAVLPGKTDPDRWILIGGHYDTLNLKVPAEIRGDPAKTAEVPAPGVTDDGTGTACAMECARVLSQYEFDATLVFVAFVAEEQGLLGARGLAKNLREKNLYVEGVLNNDMMGNDTNGASETDNHRILVFSEDPADSPSRQLARYIKLIGGRYYPELTVDMVFRYDRFGRGGDHTPFNEEGFAGVRFTTPQENFSNQHSPTDTFANTSVPYTAKVIRLNAAVASSLALAPRPPVTMPESAAPRPKPQPGTEGQPAGGNAAARPAMGQGAGRTRAGITRGTMPDGSSGYDAVLRWDFPAPPPDLAGFMVVVRSTTAADWEREIWVGNVREATIKNLPIDQWVLGVKAIDRDGHESPVSAYYTAPRRAE
jgi:hypothetical protein